MGGASQRVLWVMMLIIIILEGCWSIGGKGCLEQERSALLQLRHFFNNPYFLRDWVDDDDKNYHSDCCQWQGVECSYTTGRVITLFLGFMRDTKSTEKWHLNVSLFSPFQQLEILHLEGNNIAGCVENEGLERLSGLTNLHALHLGRNYFNNSILSSLAGLSSLRELYLFSNNLKGSIDVKGLSKLEYLYLSDNNLNLNISLTGLSSLTILSLSANGFKGSFDFQVLDSLSNLEELDLSFNEIDNIVIPKAYKGLRKLYSLDLSRVKIRDVRKLSQSLGSFPSLNILILRFNNFTVTSAFGLLCELVHLQELYIDHNDLRGNLPWCLANMTSLRVLDISFNQLTGNISSSPLLHLTSIEELSLSNNQFQIPISLEPFFNFSKLKAFSGGSSELYAEIQSHSLAPKFQLSEIELSGYGIGLVFPKFLFHQHELEYVDLSHVNLSGEFPNWLLENNTNLAKLYLSNNSLSGPFHMPIHYHKQLRTLDISSNLFQGNIPVEIGAYLPSLNELNLSRNAFNDSIPSSFGDMKSLEILDLSNNQLVSEIPEKLAMGCFNLRILVLSNNSLQGHIFSKNFNLTDLQRLQLDGNHFNGEIPESLSKCSFLGGLYLSDNNISGKIPKWLGNLSLVEDIIMPNNYLEGPIPTEFCQLHFLQILDLSENNITGSLPSCFGLSSLKEIHLSKNMLQGPLKDGTFYNSSSLVTLDLSYNRLNGIIPLWIEKLTQLRYLILANNNLEGEVLNQLCQLKQLRLIDFSHNNLSGQIPTCLDHTSFHEGYYDASAPTFSPQSFPKIDTGDSMGKEETITFTTKEISYSYKGKPLKGMYGIDLSCNKLTGEIPPQIGELTRIHVLNLSHNNLIGIIPVTFSGLKQVESLDLSYNNLNGKIPAQLVELNFLTVLNVAHNNLSGKIPEWTAQFATFNESSYQGNPFLCGPPLNKSCNENGSSPSAVPEASAGNEEDDCLIDMASFYITFIISYVIVILGIIAVLWVNPYWRRRWFYLIEIWMISCYYFVLDNIIPTRFCLGCM